MFSWAEINVCHFIKYSLEKASTSFACTVKGLAKAFLCFPTSPVQPSISVQKKSIILRNTKSTRHTGIKI